MEVLGLPVDTALALLVMLLLPVVTYLLYREDVRRNGEPETVDGYGEASPNNML